MGETISTTYAGWVRTGWTMFWMAWVAVGVILIALGLALGFWAMVIPGLVLVVVFTPFMILTRQRFADPRPVIVMGPEGYHDRRLGKVIPWTEMTSLKGYQPGNRIILQIEVPQPERFLGNAGVLAKPMQRYNPAMGMPVIGSHLSGMDVPQDRLLAIAEGWFSGR